MSNLPTPPEISFRCPKSWDGMEGNDQRRFCDQCHLHVVDLSAMSRRAGETLLAQRGEQTCITYRTRADGSMVTAPRWRLLIRSAGVMRGGLAALLALVAPLLFAGCADTRRTMGKPGPPSEVRPTPTPPGCERTMGMVATPPKH